MLRTLGCVIIRQARNFDRHRRRDFALDREIGFERRDEARELPRLRIRRWEDEPVGVDGVGRDDEHPVLQGFLARNILRVPDELERNFTTVDQRLDELADTTGRIVRGNVNLVSLHARTADITNTRDIGPDGADEILELSSVCCVFSHD